MCLLLGSWAFWLRVGFFKVSSVSLKVLCRGTLGFRVLGSGLGIQVQELVS